MTQTTTISFGSLKDWGLLSTIVFTAGVSWAQINETAEEMDQLRAAHSKEIASLNRELKEVRSGQNRALSDLRVFGAQITHIENLLEKLDKRTERAYGQEGGK